MPKGNGIEVVKHLRKQSVNLPVLFASGYSPRRLTDQLELDSKMKVIAKPYASKELLKAMRELIDH